jgi:hypothetical protein
LPRTISVIADNALLGGFASGERPVGDRLVREVCRDFDISFAQDEAPARKRQASPFRQLLAVNRSAIVDGSANHDAKPVENPVVAPERRSSEGMFAAFSVKRKRFSFFRS